jgi:hypothetical protein
VPIPPRWETLAIPMKSAFELAMERLSKSDPGSGKSLTAAQRAKLAEIDRVYKGKIAEREIFLKQRLEQALAGQVAEEVDKIRKEIASERTRLEEDREAEKDVVRGKA